MLSTKQSKRFLLIDCDHFFVSCERLFNPALRNKPVVVLSSNDACIIARSPEAKALGITMGQPYYECRQLIQKHNVFVFSSNFTLYADISARIMHTIGLYIPDIEIYSIDEAFATIMLPEDLPTYATDVALHLRRMIYKHVGIPVTIGIGLTKTLAKIAHTFAKKDPSHVFDLSLVDTDSYLEQLPLEEIWGIGRRFGKKLRAYGLKTILDVKAQEPWWIQKHMTVTGLRTHQELHGIISMSLNHEEDVRKSLTVSQLFGRPITTEHELQEATAAYLARAVEKLRRQKSCAQHVTVYAVVQGHHDPQRRYVSAYTTLSLPTNYTPHFTEAATMCIKKIFKPHLLYRKVGVILSDLVAATEQQLSVDVPAIDTRHEQIMKTITQAHRRWGRDTLFFAIAGTTRTWRVKQHMRSPLYTTQWKDLLTIS